jgi:hypothetical protein
MTSLGRVITRWRRKRFAATVRSALIEQPDLPPIVHAAPADS